ncbi:MAG: zinc ABC transporter substrate-binding protein [Bradymonadaceae bacterium]|nr:zinc ABC transporter substrate-binding protein [Lujinxingiaceae bacterium]
MKSLPNTMKLLIILAFALAMVLPASGLAEVRIVATVGDLAAMAREVAGGDAVVDLLARPSEDPHFVDPKPSYVRRLARADVLVYTGVDLEIGWLPTLLIGSRNAALQPGQPGNFDASHHVVLQGVAAGPVDRSMGDVHPGGNPHYTTDPRQMARVALAFGQTMGRIDPDNAPAYRERARNFARDCIRTAQRWEEHFAQLPANARKFVSYHEAFNYVASWLGLEDVIRIEPKPGIAPNPRHVARVVEAIKSQKIRLILQSEYYPLSTANILAQQTGAKIVVIAAQTREDQRYVEHIDHVVSLIFEGLHEH